MRLNGKVAIITGAGAGIGKAAAILFAAEGATVHAWDLKMEALQAVAAEGKGKIVPHVVDVTNRPQIKETVEKILGTDKKIDILVNNAGITADGLLIKMDEAAWDRVINVNLKGVFNCCQAVMRAMIDNGGGSIINTSSVVGVYGNPGQVNYSATKAGVIGMTKTLCKEMGKKKIRVNAVAPGFISTDMTAKVPEKVLTMMLEKTPLQRLGSPEDIARAYLFLASDESSFVSGQVLGVDGGLSL
ncbi:MAG: 3-oxoacyl-[acyl-carrier-protein] reductase [Candidatus Riflebacteria bacterium]|nr:3-oxoacyl-[acyl-carrier-protein] reductase [Candidatus Riflebacteria bacterium]